VRLETAAWLDKTVRVPKVSSLTLEQWVAEYERLKKLNEEILRDGVDQVSWGVAAKMTGHK
jgi:hypothetical protein